MTLELLPSVVTVGTPLRVRWQIHGPEAFSDASTRLLVTPAQGQAVVGSTGQVSSLPARFEATVTIPTRGRVLLVAEASINGTSYTAQKTLVVE